MSKKKNVLKMLTAEKKVANWKMRKRKKVIAFSATVLAIGLAVGGLAYAGTQATSAYPTPPTDTTVNWTANSDLAHIVLQDGTTDPLTRLFLPDNTPVFCLGLGVPLTDSSTSAQQSLVNDLWAKLTPEQQAIINNVGFLARQAGDDLSYAGGRLAIYQLLDSYGVSTNQATGIVTESSDKLQDANAITQKASDLIAQAKAMRQLPSFNNTTVQIVQGVETTVTDTKGVLPNFPYLQNNLDGVTANVSGNDLKLKADISSKHGVVAGAFKFMNTQDMNYDELPWFIYSTNGDDSGETSQTVMASNDPSRTLASLNINIIGLGETNLLKHDADTNSTETQGEASLVNSVWGLYKAGTDTLVNYSDGQNGYPITVTSGDKTDDKTIQLKMTDLTKGVGVKNLDNSQKYEWGELVAPEGYELSTKRYPVSFDKDDKFDSSTSNYVDNLTATDKVLDFGFGFIKAQDVNSSLTGLNGRNFEVIPQGTTKGETLTVTSGTGTDNSGYINNGLVNVPKLSIGDYLLKELPQDNDNLQLINPISIISDTVKDSDGNITGYTVTFTDTVTKQVITTLDISTDKLVDNSTMFKVNLGTLVDKPVTPVVPTIKTKAHTADGDQTIEKAEISKNTPVYDKVMLTNAEKGDQLVAQLHRIVTDKNGKVTDSKVLRTLNFDVDDETVKNQETQIQSTIDTTKDADIPEGSTVTYVWTEELFDKGTNPKTDQPEAKHDDLKDQDQTLTVEKIKPSTPKPATPQLAKPTPKVTGVLPTTGSTTGDLLAYGGMVILLATLGGTVYYMKKTTKEE